MAPKNIINNNNDDSSLSTYASSGCNVGKNKHPERFWVDYVMEASAEEHARVSVYHIMCCAYNMYSHS